MIPDAETIHTADADNVFFPAVIKDTETIDTLDADNVFMPVVIKVTESIEATDADNHFYPAVIADSEGITAADADVITAKVGILPNTTPSGTYNTPYSQTFTAVGNTGTVTLTTSGTLPTGMSFSGSGSSRTLSGTPTQTGTFPFTIKAQDTVNTTTVSYSLVINPASQTITLGTLPTPTYGGANFTLSGTATSGGAVTFASTSALATGSNPFSPAGAGNATFTASVGSTTNYASATSNFSVTISPATLTLTANSTSRAFDQPNPTFGYTLTGFVNGDPSSVVSGSPVILSFSMPLSPVSGSPYTIGIIQSTLSAANYIFSPVPGSLTINKAAQTITFYPLPTLSNGNSFPLTARASSGLVVTYGVSGPASITNNVLSITGSGLVTVTASQIGGTNYNAATPVIRSFTAP